MSFALFGLGLGWAVLLCRGDVGARRLRRPVGAWPARRVLRPALRASPARRSRSRAGAAYNDIGVEAIAVGATIAVALPAVVITLAHRRPPAEVLRADRLVADEREKLVVVADVVRRVVRMRREHEQHGVARVPPLGTPDEGRDVQADRRPVELDLIPRALRRRRGTSTRRPRRRGTDGRPGGRARREPTRWGRRKRRRIAGLEGAVGQLERRQSTAFVARVRQLMHGDSGHSRRPYDRPVGAGIHETSIVSPAAAIGDGADVGPFCLVGECRIGSRALVRSHA